MKHLKAERRIVGIVFLIVLLGFIGKPVCAFELKWGTGRAGGLWVTIGAAMVERVKNENPDITGTALPGQGGHNFLGIKSGRFNIAFATTDASTFAWEGKEIYAGKKFQGFRNVACLYPHISQYLVWADSGIKTFADLKGKKITYGGRGSGSELNVRKLLEFYGVLDQVRFEYLSFSDASNRMKDRHIDGFFLNSAFPFPVYMELANMRPIRFLEVAEDKIKAMLSWNSGLDRSFIPAGGYKGIDKRVDGFAYRMHLVAAADVPDDIVYKITRTIARNLPNFGKVAKAMASVTVKDMAREISLPFHPGAERYYKEANVR